MNGLPRTQEALAELQAQEQLGFGSHILPDVQTGVPGLVLGELDYNPRRDSARHIVSSSIREMVTGVPQVRQYAPYQQLHINFVDHMPASADALGIPEAKRRLSAVLFDTVIESLPGMTDHVRKYSVGALAVRKTRVSDVGIKTDGSPEADAAAVAAITRTGLTFVVSDFLNLPLDKQNRKHFPATVALKINHPIELAVQPGKYGRIVVAGAGEVNPKKPKEVARFNENLKQVHQTIIANLGSVGIAVAQLTLSPEHRSGFENRITDRAISRAIGQVTQF